MDSKIFPTLNPQRWDRAKSCLATCVREGRTGAFTSLFFVCTSVPRLCCVACFVLHLQDTFAAMSRHSYRGTACMANLVAYPVPPNTALCTSTFELYLKAAAELGLKVQKQRKSTNPARPMQPLVPRVRSAGSAVPGPCMSAMLYAARTARQERTDCHCTGGG